MSFSDHQLRWRLASSLTSWAPRGLSHADPDFLGYLEGRIQSVLREHPQVYVQHVEIPFNDDAEAPLPLSPERLQRFCYCLRYRIARTLAVSSLRVGAGLRCEWFVTDQGPTSLHLLAFVEQRAFVLLGDERQSSRAILNRHIEAAWGSSAGRADRISSLGERGGFYLSAPVGDRGVASLLDAMRAVTECSFTRQHWKLATI